MSPFIKYCVVPQCKSTVTKTPEKLFFYVPKDPKIRKKWTIAMRRADPLGPKTVGYCCEDHFDVENDMDNYVKHKLVGGPLKLKKDVMPHKFDCQNRLVEKRERSDKAKLKTAKLKTAKLKTAKFKTANYETTSFENIASTSHNVEQLYIVHPITVRLNNQNIDIDPLGDTTGNTATYTNITKKKHKNIQVNITNKVSHKGTKTESKYFNLPPKHKKTKNATKKEFTKLTV